MVKLHELPKTTTGRKKRIGRGYGSGVGGHTSTRGSKGFKSRNKVPLTFDGSKIKKSWLKRLPFLRGKGRQKAFSRLAVVNVGSLESAFKKGDLVGLSSLIKKGLLKKSESTNGVKILGKGKLAINLTVNLPCSRLAEEKIKKAGGKVKNGQLV